MSYRHITVPEDGQKIRINADFSLTVPAAPIIPFIEGDGIGIDVTPAMRRVVDAAVGRAYGTSRRIRWMEVYSGEKAAARYGQWFPDETLQALREFVVAIKGPLGTPVGGGLRSLNVAMRFKAPKRELAARRNVEEDLQRLIPGATLMTCSGFATAVVRHMDD
ncbi:MAG: hypothetical protein PVSMB6_21670 [Steroidobacteraceae bacterium]